MTALLALSDTDLVDLIKSGDHNAFNEIYNRHWKYLFQMTYNVCRNREDSSDVCQTVFLWLWENRQTLNISTSLKVYLCTAVKYKIANIIRQGKVRESLFDDLKIIDIRVYKENELEIKELKSFISQLINELPERCRQVFIMSREQHLSHKDIAERLGIAEKTVDDHITRALRKLRNPLERLATIFLFFL